MMTLPVPDYDHAPVPDYNHTPVPNMSIAELKSLDIVWRGCGRGSSSNNLELPGKILVMVWNV